MNCILRLILAIPTIICYSAFAHSSNEESIQADQQFQYFYYDDLSQELVNSQVIFLEENYLKIMNDLELKELPAITVRFFAEYENLYKAEEERLGERFEGSAGFVW